MEYKKKLLPAAILSGMFLSGCSIHDIRLSQGCGIGMTLGVLAGYAAGGDAGSIILTTFIGTILGCEAAKRLDRQLVEASNKIEHYVNLRDVTLQNNEKIIAEIQRYSNIIKDLNRQVATAMTDKNANQNMLDEAKLAVRKQSSSLYGLHAKIGQQVDKINDYIAHYNLSYSDKNKLYNQLKTLESQKHHIQSLIYQSEKLVG